MGLFDPDLTAGCVRLDADFDAGRGDLDLQVYGSTPAEGEDVPQLVLDVIVEVDLPGAKESTLIELAFAAAEDIVGGRIDCAGRLAGGAAGFAAGFPGGPAGLTGDAAALTAVIGADLKAVVGVLDPDALDLVITVGRDGADQDVIPLDAADVNSPLRLWAMTSRGARRSIGNRAGKMAG